MPLSGFICPDNVKIDTVDCLDKCRMEDRCCPWSWLESIGYDREWRGITASMAGNGVRMIWLKRTTDYYIDPDSRSFAIIGTRGHAKLSQADYNRLTEERLEVGTADLLEQVGNNLYDITDYKVWGSYKVAECLKNKSVGHSDALQQNRYRIEFESKGFPIGKMRIFAIRRDACKQFNRQYKLDKNTYYLPVPVITDTEVIDYYSHMGNMLIEAMRINHAPLCSKEDAWDGRRCKGYCDVSENCIKLGDNTYVNGDK